MIRSPPLLVVGLTGGIGSGKSTVARMLAERGALVVDTDDVARQVVEPGQPAYDRVVARFGRDVVGPDGRLDRAALAERAFSDADPQARSDLNAIVHPAVAAVVADILDHAPPDAVVVLEVPLLVEAGWDEMVARVVVVDCDPEIAVRRLVDGRGMDEADVRRRMAAQAPRADRLAAADLVIDNSGSLDDLEDQVQAFWADL